MAQEWEGPELPQRTSPRQAQRMAAARAAAGTPVHWGRRTLIAGGCVAAVVALSMWGHGARDPRTPTPPAVATVAPAERLDVVFHGYTLPAMQSACDFMGGELIQDGARFTCEDVDR